MSEIKFRAWDKLKKEMHPVTRLEFANKGVIGGQFGWYGTGWVYDSFIIMQYTGLKDKNNKEIYEGDIISVPSLYKEEILEDGSGPKDEYFQICKVVKQEGCFGIITKKDELFNKGFYSFREIKKDIGVNMYEIEIIGNIFDNPELKGGK